MHARLLLSHDIFSFEKKPTICGLGGGAKEVGPIVFVSDELDWECSALAVGLEAGPAGADEAACVSDEGVYTRRK